MGDRGIQHGARILVRRCARVQPTEQVVIVTDSEKLRIAQVLFNEVAEAGATVVLAQMTIRTRDAQEPPPSVAAAMLAADMIFTPVTVSITHTDAVRRALDRGGRVVALSAFTEKMMRGGGIDADFEAIAPVCRAIAQRFTQGHSLHLTTAAGTDLRATIAGRKGNAMTGMPGPGELSPVPTIEANVSPIEGTAQGVIVADASIPYLKIGILDEPVRLEVIGGMITRIVGGYQAATFEEALKSTGDPNSWNVAEIGVGLNPEARMAGLMLEDEAVAGTVHVGIGTSITLGGSVKAASHYDVIMWSPTLQVDGEYIIRDGHVVVGAV